MVIGVGGFLAHENKVIKKGLSLYEKNHPNLIPFKELKKETYKPNASDKGTPEKMTKLQKVLASKYIEVYSTANGKKLFAIGYKHYGNCNMDITECELYRIDKSISNEDYKYYFSAACRYMSDAHKWIISYYKKHKDDDKVTKESCADMILEAVENGTITEEEEIILLESIL